MGYQVIRVEKLKSATRILGRMRHATRARAPENADPDRLRDNTTSLVLEDGRFLNKDQTTHLSPEAKLQAAMARYRSLLPQKFRKDAVQALEFVVTATHDDLAKASRAQQDRYLNHAAAWVIEKFGGKDNLIMATVHRDEQTPHLSLFMVPRISTEQGEARLSAKHFIDGPKSLAQLQTDFHEQVSSHYGLDRGRQFSPARHMTVQQYYSMTNEVASEVKRQQEKQRTQHRKTRRESGFER